VIRRPERFAKTAVGWILREVSRNDPLFVRRVVTDNMDYFSPEGLKNAIKYFSKEEREGFRELLKDAQAGSKLTGASSADERGAPQRRQPT
jgi:hypothetical protein